MVFIERNDQLKLLDLIKSKVTTDSNENKPKKSKVKYQKINPWIKGSSRHEYFKLDPVVSYISSVKQLLHKQCLRCGSSILDGSVLQCLKCLEQFHASCVQPVACADAQRSQTLFTCQDCSQCYLCLGKMNDAEDKKELVLNCTNRDCEHVGRSYHYSCYDNTQLNSDIIPLIAYKFKCNSCFTCRICTKFNHKTLIAGCFELKDKPFFACRVNQLQEYISNQGYDNSLCITCFAMTLVSMCEVCDQKITTSQVNDELAVMIKEKVNSKLTVDYVSCAICLKKYHLRCIKARNSVYLNNNDFYYECRSCSHTKQPGRNHNPKNVQFVHKFLSSLIRFKFSKFEQHCQRLVQDYQFFESRFMLLDNPHIKQLFEKFKINNNKSRRRRESKCNAAIYYRPTQENILSTSHQSLANFVETVKLIEINPYTQLEKISQMYHINARKSHDYWYNLEYPNSTQTQLKTSIFRDSSQYLTLMQNQNTFMIQEIQNDTFQYDFTKLITKQNYINLYSRFDWQSHISYPVLKLNQSLGQQEPITDFYQRKNYTQYQYSNKAWDKTSGMLYINDINFQIANSLTNVNAQNQHSKLISESMSGKDLLISDINSVNEMKHIQYSSIKILQQTTEFITNLGEEMSQNDKFEQYNMIYTMQGIVKANFNDFLDSDDKSLMLKIVQSDMNSDFDSDINCYKTQGNKHKSASNTSINDIIKGDHSYNPNYQKCILCKRGYSIEIRINKRIQKSNFNLIPCFSTYVHRACVFQSPDVIELQDGSLLNVPHSIYKSKNVHCTKCLTDYANIQCMSCRSYWHLPCLLENKGYIQSKETNMCFCNWTCLEKQNSDADKMRPLQSYKDIHKLDPRRFMYIARLDTEQVDQHNLTKNTTAKRSGFILGLYNRLGEYIVLNVGKQTDLAQSQKLSTGFVFPELYSFMRRIQIASQHFIVICEQGKDNLASVMILNYGNEDRIQNPNENENENKADDTSNQTQTSQIHWFNKADDILGSNVANLDLKYNIMKLINVQKNTINTASSNLGRIDISGKDVVQYTNFKKTIKDIFNPEVQNYKIIESIQGSIAIDVLASIEKEQNVNCQLVSKSILEEKFTQCGSVVVQNWFQNNSLITDYESDLQTNLQVSVSKLQNKNKFDQSTLSKLDYVSKFHQQITSVFEQPNDFNRVTSTINERGENVIIKDNLLNLPNPRFNLQIQEKNAMSKREFMLSSKQEKPDSDLQDWPNTPLRDRYEIFLKNKTYKFVSSQSKIHGIGLFATHNIRREEIIVEQLGEIVSEMQSDSREKVQEKLLYGGCQMFSLEDNQIVDGSIQGNFARYINHSCAPNSYAEILNQDEVKQILIIANKDIEKGTEITQDYKFAQEGNAEKCYCGCVSCFSRMN